MLGKCVDPTALLPNIQNIFVVRGAKKKVLEALGKRKTPLLDPSHANPVIKNH